MAKSPEKIVALVGEQLAKQTRLTKDFLVKSLRVSINIITSLFFQLKIIGLFCYSLLNISILYFGFFFTLNLHLHVSWKLEFIVFFHEFLTIFYILLYELNLLLHFSLVLNDRIHDSLITYLSASSCYMSSEHDILAFWFVVEWPNLWVFIVDLS